MNDVIKSQTGLTIFLDNARSHTGNNLKEKIKESGNKLVFNIPYSPQFNPIEYLNNVIKGKLKSQYVEDIDELGHKLEKIIQKIPEQTYENCFKHSIKSITATN